MSFLSSTILAHSLLTTVRTQGKLTLLLPSPATFDNVMSGKQQSDILVRSPQAEKVLKVGSVVTWKSGQREIKTKISFVTHVTGVSQAASIAGVESFGVEGGNLSELKMLFRGRDPRKELMNNGLLIRFQLILVAEGRSETMRPSERGVLHFPTSTPSSSVVSSSSSTFSSSSSSSSSSSQAQGATRPRGGSGKEGAMLQFTPITEANQWSAMPALLPPIFEEENEIPQGRPRRMSTSMSRKQKIGTIGRGKPQEEENPFPDIFGSPDLGEIIFSKFGPIVPEEEEEEGETEPIVPLVPAESDSEWSRQVMALFERCARIECGTDREEIDRMLEDETVSSVRLKDIFGKISHETQREIIQISTTEEITVFDALDFLFARNHGLSADVAFLIWRCCQGADQNHWICKENLVIFRTPPEDSQLSVNEISLCGAEILNAPVEWHEGKNEKIDKSIFNHPEFLIPFDRKLGCVRFIFERCPRTFFSGKEELDVIGMVDPFPGKLEFDIPVEISNKEFTPGMVVQDFRGARGIIIKRTETHLRVKTLGMSGRKPITKWQTRRFERPVGRASGELFIGTHTNSEFLTATQLFEFLDSFSMVKTDFPETYGVVDRTDIIETTVMGAKSSFSPMFQFNSSNLGNGKMIQFSSSVTFTGSLGDLTKYRSLAEMSTGGLVALPTLGPTGGLVIHVPSAEIANEKLFKTNTASIATGLKGMGCISVGDMANQGPFCRGDAMIANAVISDNLELTKVDGLSPLDHQQVVCILPIVYAFLTQTIQAWSSFRDVLLFQSPEIRIAICIYVHHYYSLKRTQDMYKRLSELIPLTNPQTGATDFLNEIGLEWRKDQQKLMSSLMMSPGGINGKVNSCKFDPFLRSEDTGVIIKAGENLMADQLPQLGLVRYIRGPVKTRQADSTIDIYVDATFNGEPKLCKRFQDTFGKAPKTVLHELEELNNSWRESQIVTSIGGTMRVYDDISFRRDPPKVLTMAKTISPGDLEPVARPPMLPGSTCQGNIPLKQIIPRKDNYDRNFPDLPVEQAVELLARVYQKKLVTPCGHGPYTKEAPSVHQIPIQASALLTPDVGLGPIGRTGGHVSDFHLRNLGTHLTLDPFEKPRLDVAAFISSTQRMVPAARIEFLDQTILELEITEIKERLKTEKIVPRGAYKTAEDVVRKVFETKEGFVSDKSDKLEWKFASKRMFCLKDPANRYLTEVFDRPVYSNPHDDLFLISFNGYVIERPGKSRKKTYLRIPDATIHEIDRMVCTTHGREFSIRGIQPVNSADNFVAFTQGERVGFVSAKRKAPQFFSPAEGGQIQTDWDWNFSFGTRKHINLLSLAISVFSLGELPDLETYVDPAKERIFRMPFEFLKIPAVEIPDDFKIDLGTDREQAQICPKCGAYAHEKAIFCQNGHKIKDSREGPPLSKGEELKQQKAEQNMADQSEQFANMESWMTQVCLDLTIGDTIVFGSTGVQFRIEDPHKRYQCNFIAGTAATNLAVMTLPNNTQKVLLYSISKSLNFYKRIKKEFCKWKDVEPKLFNPGLLQPLLNKALWNKRLEVVSPVSAMTQPPTACIYKGKEVDREIFLLHYVEVLLEIWGRLKISGKDQCITCWKRPAANVPEFPGRCTPCIRNTLLQSKPRGGTIEASRKFVVPMIKECKGNLDATGTGCFGIPGLQGAAASIWSWILTDYAYFWWPYVFGPVEATAQAGERWPCLRGAFASHCQRIPNEVIAKAYHEQMNLLYYARGKSAEKLRFRNPLGSDHLQRQKDCLARNGIASEWFATQELDQEKSSDSIIAGIAALSDYLAIALIYRDQLDEETVRRDLTEIIKVLSFPEFFTKVISRPSTLPQNREVDFGVLKISKEVAEGIFYEREPFRAVVKEQEFVIESELSWEALKMKMGSKILPFVLENHEGPIDILDVFEDDCPVMMIQGDWDEETIESEIEKIGTFCIRNRIPIGKVEYSDSHGNVIQWQPKLQDYCSNSSSVFVPEVFNPNGTTEMNEYQRKMAEFIEGCQQEIEKGTRPVFFRALTLIATKMWPLLTVPNLSTRFEKDIVSSYESQLGDDPLTEAENEGKLTRRIDQTLFEIPDHTGLFKVMDLAPIVLEMVTRNRAWLKLPMGLGKSTAVLHCAAILTSHGWSISEEKVQFWYIGSQVSLTEAAVEGVKTFCEKWNINCCVESEFFSKKTKEGVYEKKIWTGQEWKTSTDPADMVFITTQRFAKMDTWVDCKEFPIAYVDEVQSNTIYPHLNGRKGTLVIASGTWTSTIDPNVYSTIDVTACSVPFAIPCDESLGERELVFLPHKKHIFELTQALPETRLTGCAQLNRFQEDGYTLSRSSLVQTLERGQCHVQFLCAKRPTFFKVNEIGLCGYGPCLFLDQGQLSRLLGVGTRSPEELWKILKDARLCNAFTLARGLVRDQIFPRKGIAMQQIIKVRSPIPIKAIVMIPLLQSNEILRFCRTTGSWQPRAVTLQAFGEGSKARLDYAIEHGAESRKIHVSTTVPNFAELLRLAGGGSILVASNVRRGAEESVLELGIPVTTVFMPAKEDDRVKEFVASTSGTLQMSEGEIQDGKKVVLCTMASMPGANYPIPPKVIILDKMGMFLSTAGLTGHRVEAVTTNLFTQCVGRFGRGDGSHGSLPPEEDCYLFVPDETPIQATWTQGEVEAKCAEFLPQLDRNKERIFPGVSIPVSHGRLIDKDAEPCFSYLPMFTRAAELLVGDSFQPGPKLDRLIDYASSYGIPGKFILFGCLKARVKWQIEQMLQQHDSYCRLPSSVQTVLKEACSRPDIIYSSSGISHFDSLTVDRFIENNRDGASVIALLLARNDGASVNGRQINRLGVSNILFRGQMDTKVSRVEAAMRKLFIDPPGEIESNQKTTPTNQFVRSILNIVQVVVPNFKSQLLSVTTRYRPEGGFTCVLKGLGMGESIGAIVTFTFGLPGLVSARIFIHCGTGKVDSEGAGDDKSGMNSIIVTTIEVLGRLVIGSPINGFKTIIQIFKEMAMLFFNATESHSTLFYKEGKDLKKFSIEPNSHLSSIARAILACYEGTANLKDDVAGPLFRSLLKTEGNIQSEQLMEALNEVQRPLTAYTAILEKVPITSKTGRLQITHLAFQTLLGALTLTSKMKPRQRVQVLSKFKEIKIAMTEAETTLTVGHHVKKIKNMSKGLYFLHPKLESYLAEKEVDFDDFLADLREGEISPETSALVSGYLEYENHFEADLINMPLEAEVLTHEEILAMGPHTGEIDLDEEMLREVLESGYEQVGDETP